MALNKEKISIINTKGYRYYLIPGLSEPLPSVTSILSTISKPGLISWEKEVAIDYARENIVPPTINLNEPDSECDLNYTPNKSLHKNLFYTMSNSFGFGGHNCSLIFSKPSN